MPVPTNTTPDPLPKWNQDEAIAYEAAIECIGHLIALHTERIDRERATPDYDEKLVSTLITERTRLAHERRDLHVFNHEIIARIRSEYGALIRSQTAARSSINPSEKI
ncbi:hypothetical protein [Rhodoferax sp.]|uniref:hypothetical protein n=1 Tax=Rhodoferax sp. TaxID=50421 RepID=UPI002851D1EA|nr:hypothetical protein [Rhodoferax sp.]MDR3371956.1 hypothetical protein [Rhodoferax sp.]